MLLHIFLEKGHFEKLNCEIKFMGTFNTAKKWQYPVFCAAAQINFGKNNKK